MNDCIIEHLKRGKYDKTLKLFEGEINVFKKENTKIYENFMKYLIDKEIKRENDEDDLGFEINFGAYKPESKVSFFISYF